jgi:hypothetical protein
MSGRLIRRTRARLTYTSSVEIGPRWVSTEVIKPQGSTCSFDRGTG